MRILGLKYLGIYHNPFQYTQKHSLIFQNLKTKSYVIALQIDLETQSIEDIETHFMETYDVLLSNCFEDSIFEFESDQIQLLEAIVKTL